MIILITICTYIINILIQNNHIIQQNHTKPSLSQASYIQNLAAFGISSSLKSKWQLWIIGWFYPFEVDKKKNAPGFTFVKNAKSSLALNGSYPFPTLF